MTNIAEALSLALLHFVWQGIAGGIAWGVTLLVLRKHSASSRYAAGCIVLALLALAPVITFGVAYQGNVLPSQTPAVSSNASLRTLAISIVEKPATGPWLAEISHWIMPVWAIGVFVFALRLMWASGHAWSLRRKGIDADSSLVSRINSLADRLGVRRKLRVVMSSVADVPSVVGWLRPVLLLPAAVVVGLTPQQLESLLAHELAHIRRHDYFVNILQMIVETLLFYHPVVWWVSARIRYERELCCDDLAVRACGDALSYARALARLERLRPVAPSLAMGSTGGPLLHRIQRLLGNGRYEHVPSKLACAAGLLTGFLCLGWFMNARAQDREPLPPLQTLESVQPVSPVPAMIPIPPRPRPPVAVPALPAPPAPVISPLPVLPMQAPAVSPLRAVPVQAPVAPAAVLPVPLPAPGVAPATPAAPAAATLPTPAAATPTALFGLLQQFSEPRESHWVLFRAGSIVARATVAEEEQAKRVRRNFEGDVLWFQVDGKTFTTQDKDVMDRIQAAAGVEPDLGLSTAQQDLDQLQRRFNSVDEQRRIEDKLRVIQAEVQASLEQINRNLRNLTVDSASAQQQRELQAARVQMDRLQAMNAQMQAELVKHEAELRATRNQIDAARRTTERQVVREMEILREAVREGKAQVVPEP